MGDYSIFLSYICLVGEMRLGDSLGEKVEVFFELGRVSEAMERTDGDYLTWPVKLYALVGLNFLAGDLTFAGDALLRRWI